LISRSKHHFFQPAQCSERRRRYSARSSSPTKRTTLSPVSASTSFSFPERGGSSSSGERTWITGGLRAQPKELRAEPFVPEVADDDRQPARHRGHHEGAADPQRLELGERHGRGLLVRDQRECRPEPPGELELRRHGGRRVDHEADRERLFAGELLDVELPEAAVQVPVDGAKFVALGVRAVGGELRGAAAAPGEPLPFPAPGDRAADGKTEPFQLPEECVVE
jgi:hypothetical protein